MKTLTLTLGALAATSAIVYLSASADHDEDDLVAIRPQVRYTAPVNETGERDTAKQPEAEKTLAARTQAEKVQGESGSAPPLDPEALGTARAPSSRLAKVDLFRALEAPSKPEGKAVETNATDKPMVVPPKPPFNLIGTFRDGDELQAILQIGEIVEFAKLNQVLAGFRVDSIDPTTLAWTHQASDTKGILSARGPK